MKYRSIHTFLLFLSLNLFLFPSRMQAQTRPDLRGFTPREWRPFGQMREEIYENTATFRLIRTQEERRPRDARALGPQDLGPPGIARPELINTLRRGRQKAYGGGWFYGHGDTTSEQALNADPNEGFLPNMEDQTDTTAVRQNLEIDTTEWWEQKFRGQGQRGGWFRARFGSASTGVGTGTSTAPIRSGGGTTSQTQQQSSAAIGESMLGGVGVGR